MKIRFYALSIAIGVFTLSGCNDEMGLVGSTIQPEGDKSIVYTDTFMLEASTVLVDSVYGRSSYGLLGEFYDPLYGNLKSDYICQFYSAEGFKFSRTPIEGKIDSVDLEIFYNRGEWIGDTLAPMQVKVFPIVKQLERNFYTHLNPAEYADMQRPLGQQVYTPRNLNVSDSIWNLSTSDANYYSNPRIKLQLPNALGQKFYDETITRPETFANQTSFNAFFPGLYVTNTFGSGNVVVVSNTALIIYYRYLTESSSGALDSIINTYEVFTVTREVLQLNNFRNTDMTHLLTPNDEYAYLKTPAGVFTRLTLPVKDILSKVKGRRINNFSLSLTAMPQEEWKYTLTPPGYLLLIPEDSVSLFFKEGKMYNSVTTFISSQYSSLTYSFGNISTLLTYLQENAPDLEELHLLVVPVEVNFQTDPYTGSQIVTEMNNYLKPSGVRLRKDPEALRFRIVSSKYSTEIDD
ncbi:MAG: DUF4270 domain-containing protein [Tannerellaceae bacterium]|jgi:hypothetical protein|nr:DUF4270 domain-containing protein [Tannerellaceae bacterium]